LGGVTNGALGMLISMPKLNLNTSGGCTMGRDISKFKPDGVRTVNCQSGKDQLTRVMDIDWH
jgi:hypothetical protein